MLERRGDLAHEPRDRDRVVAPAVLARVDEPDEVLDGPQAGVVLGAGHDLGLPGALDHGRAVDAPASLAVPLRPVQRDVGEPLQLLDLVRALGTRRDPGADRHRDVARAGRVRELVLNRLDPIGSLLGSPVQEQRELVTAEPERGSAAERGEPGCDVGERLVPCSVAQRVVDPLEVVDVDEAQGRRLGSRGGVHRGADGVLVGAVVAEARQAVRVSGQPGKPCAPRVTLVETEGQERPGEQEEQRRIDCPERGRERRHRAHDQECGSGVSEVVDDHGPWAVVLHQRRRNTDEGDIEREEDRALDEDDHRHRSVVRAPGQAQSGEVHDRRGRGRDCVDRAVERQPERRRAALSLRDQHRADADGDGVLPAEQHLGCDDEDERQGDDARVVEVERQRLQLDRDRAEEEDGYAGQSSDGRLVHGQHRRRDGNDRRADGDHREDEADQPRLERVHRAHARGSDPVQGRRLSHRTPVPPDAQPAAAHAPCASRRVPIFERCNVGTSVVIAAVGRSDGHITHIATVRDPASPKTVMPRAPNPGCAVGCRSAGPPAVRVQASLEGSAGTGSLDGSSTRISSGSRRSMVGSEPGPSTG